jgi:hypothetical protein
MIPQVEEDIGFAEPKKRVVWWVKRGRLWQEVEE